MSYYRCARRPLSHRCEQLFRGNPVDVRVFVLIWNAGQRAVSCPFPLYPVENHASKYYKEYGAERSAKGNQYGDAVRVVIWI